VPITLGHALSLIAVAGLVIVSSSFISPTVLSLLTASTLLTFGVYKLFNYYRHPRWVGMRVGFRDLLVWSFLMAVAHGAGLMVAPSLVSIANAHAADSSYASPMVIGTGISVGIIIHTAAMLVVMAPVAWIVYKKVGLTVLRTSWINFDLVWAIALLVVGGFALWQALI
jgi:hypothetical protein